MPPYLIHTYHPIALGSSRKQAIYAWFLSDEKNKNKQKEAGFGTFFLKKTMESNPGRCVPQVLPKT